jgi:hypothetical protein
MKLNIFPGSQIQGFQRGVTSGMDSELTSGLLTQQSRIQADIWYLDRLDLYKDERPYMITFDVSGFSGSKTNHSYSKYPVVITDVRFSQKKFSIDVQGFEFRNWATKLDSASFDNERVVREQYYPEILEHVRTAFPSISHIHVFAHLVFHGSSIFKIIMVANVLFSEGNEGLTF